MTDTFLDCTGRACPILGADSISGPSLSSDILNIPIFSSACECDMTLHVPPAGSIFTGQRQAGKALDENELQHACSVDAVSTITHRFVPWFAKTTPS